MSGLTPPKTNVEFADRLNNAGHQCTFDSLRASIDATPATGAAANNATQHAAAHRNLFDCVIGQLYHCLEQGKPYDESLDLEARPSEAVVGAA